HGVESGLISAEDAALLGRAAAARRDAIQVDDFSLEELRGDAVPGDRAEARAARRLDVAGG
ncbi:MAG: hypothetical protein AAGF23_10925, partial [Acidobacteriota bacterium]